MIKKMLLWGCVCMMTLNVASSVPALAKAADGFEESDVKYSLMRTVYEWRFKTENGKTYRRLWDATNKKWVTDWILC